MTVTSVPPGVIAAVVGEVRAFLRLEAGEDDLLARVAVSAVSVAEAFTGTLLVRRAVEDVFPASGSQWQLLEALPVSAIAGVTGLPVGGAPFVLAADAYAIDVDADARGWVRVISPESASRVAVSYTAGLAVDWDGVPGPLAQGVVMLAAHLFNDREAGASPPAAVAALWRPYRRMRLAVEARR